MLKRFALLICAGASTCSAFVDTTRPKYFDNYVIQPRNEESAGSKPIGLGIMAECLYWKTHIQSFPFAVTSTQEPIIGLLNNET